MSADRAEVPRVAMFQRPPNCPLTTECAGIVSSNRELERLKRAEARLRRALARERMLLDLRDELIRQKELLRRESDHRLLNELQMVASLLSTQGRLAKDREAAAQLRVAANRVVAISAVHRRLHAFDHQESIELREYLDHLCQDMIGLLSIDKSTLVVKGISLKVPRATGTPIGFIVTELVTNSAKYAKGEIRVELGRAALERYALSVSDDGPGLPKGFDPKKSNGLGMKIISSLVKDIEGEFIFGPGDDGRGAQFTVLFSCRSQPLVRHDDKGGSQ
jgi:two-component sensor histidine kinase